VRCAVLRCAALPGARSIGHTHACPTLIPTLNTSPKSEAWARTLRSARITRRLPTSAHGPGAPCPTLILSSSRFSAEAFSLSHTMKLGLAIGILGLNVGWLTCTSKPILALDVCCAGARWAGGAAAAGGPG
jgi:hypothetical protein